MLRNLSAGDYVDVGMTNSIGVNVNVGGADAEMFFIFMVID